MNRRRFILAGSAAGLAVIAGIGLADSWPGRRQPVRILAFGDSLTEGYGVPPDQAIPGQLQTWLRSKGVNAEVINAGLSGDTTYGGRVRINWAMRAQPDAVIVELGGNDFLRGFDLTAIERNLSAIIRRAGREGAPVLLVGIAPPDDRMPVSRAKVEAMWQRLAKKHKVLLLPDLYAPLWQKPESQWSTYLQEDQTHLSPAGVTLMISELGPLALQLVGQIAAE